jgi:glycerol uptake facilitator-like aquaporin
MTDTAPLARRLLAELLGSAFLAALVIGSGVAAQTLSPNDVGLELFENAAANPAISVGRIFSNTFAGIAPVSVPGFVAAQLVGGACAILAVRVLFPDVTPAEAAQVVLPHHEERADGGSISRPLRS